MGYRDQKLRLSASQAVGADAASAYYLNTGLTYPEWEKGQPIAVVITVERAPGGTTGVNFILCHRDAADPTSGTYTLQTTRVLNADLVKGDEIIIYVPRGVALLQYLGLYYDLIAGNETALICTSYFTPAGL